MQLNRITPINNLKEGRKLTVEKSASGVYHVNKEIFSTQIIVISELSPNDNLYLHCLTYRLTDAALISRLAEDYQAHHGQNQVTYTQYMNQLSIANTKKKGGNPMVCEGLLNLFGTSSDEIIENTRKEADAYYQPKIDTLSSKVDYLQNLLTQHNIPFSFEA
ncbi:MAG: hypothetical protein NC313_13480 [Butyrivibrio sp.]|nr:hypothetical protein [Butyrivibrio sp.]